MFNVTGGLQAKLFLFSKKHLNHVRILCPFGRQVGLAVGDIDAIRKTAYMRKKAIQIQLVADVENKYPRFITRRLYKPMVVYQPNKSGCGMQLKG